MKHILRNIAISPDGLRRIVILENTRYGVPSNVTFNTQTREDREPECWQYESSGTPVRIAAGMRWDMHVQYGGYRVTVNESNWIK